MGQEVEFKFTLTEEQYKTMVASLNPTLTETITYWNIYYDTPHSDLHNAGCTFRLSVIEDGKGGFCKQKITFKSKKIKTEHGLNTCEEVEQCLTGPSTKDEFFLHYTLLIPDRERTGPWQKIEHLTFHHPHLWVIGGVKICRIKYPYNNFIMEIDRVSFAPDAHDYELEVETDNPEFVYPQIVSFLLNHDITPMPSKKGKHHRFRKYKETQGRRVLFSW
jgi:uncharacterized protein YjbK